jgi:hypothetical protein
MAVDLDKINTIMNWPAPQNVTEVISFMRSAGDYRRFINIFFKDRSSHYLIAKERDEICVVNTV